MPTPSGISRFFFAWQKCAGLFAGKPAPTGTVQCSKAVPNLWERVYPRRGRNGRLMNQRLRRITLPIEYPAPNELNTPSEPLARSSWYRWKAITEPAELVLA